VTFPAWIYGYRHDDSPLGELACLVLADSRFPTRTEPTSRDRERILKHLEATTTMSEAARQVLRQALSAWLHEEHEHERAGGTP
jgi:hypothetical protein